MRVDAPPRLRCRDPASLAPKCFSSAKGVHRGPYASKDAATFAAGCLGELRQSSFTAKAGQAPVGPETKKRLIDIEFIVQADIC